MKQPLKSSLILILSLFFLWQVSNAQVDTISLNTNDLLTKQLQPGLHQYIVYFEMAAKKKIIAPMLWNRQVNFTEVKGKKVIEIKQHWYSADTLMNRVLYSLSERETFTPIFHYAKNARGIEAFDFEGRKVNGSDTVANNAKKDFEIALSIPTLNWELDLEVFSTLPYKKVGQTFVINFYHPGGRTPPKYYAYTVSADEIIKSTDSKTIDCWLLKIAYNETDWAIFWISKKTKEVLKMQEHFKGNYRYKVKLSTPVAVSFN